METQAPVYIKYLEFHNVANFKDTKVSFADPKNPEQPAFFTLIVGNNNTGKTTLLKILASWETYKIKGEGGEEDDQDFSPMDFDYKKKNFEIRLYIKRKNEVSNYYIKKDDFKYSNHTSMYELGFAPGLHSKILLDAYATNRKKGELNLADYQLDTIEKRVETLFNDKAELLDVEAWIRDLAASSGIGDEGAKARLEKVKEIVSLLFAEAEGGMPRKDAIHLSAKKGYFLVLFETETGEKVRLRSLGSGYQSLITWVVDLAYRMFVRYPENANPLEEPAIVLVDELDLHLHPEWQRRVVGFLRKTFPKTQFIATTHSPFLVQSYPDINLIVLEKDADNQQVSIKQPENTSFEGWTIEEILKTFMLNNPQHLYSDRMSELLAAFQSALETKNRKKAENALAELEKIVEPNSDLLELFRIRLTRIPKK